MDGLEDLQKQLYTPEKPSLPESKIEAPIAKEPIAPLPVYEDYQPSRSIWKRVFLGVGVFLLLGVTVAVYVFFRGFYAFRKDRVELKLEGPASIAAGEIAVWRLSIVNKNETELKEGELSFQFPDFSQPVIQNGESGQFKSNILKKIIPIPELKAGGLFEEDFRAVVYGGENFERKAQAVFKFKPSSGSIVFESASTVATTISSFPIIVTVEAVPETVSGEKLEIGFNLKNESDVSFQNMRARLEYPSGFRVEESSEKLYEFNNVWPIDELLPQESKNLTLRGTVTGLEGENKIFRVFTEGLEGSNWKTYKETSASVKLITPPLALYLNTDPEGLASVRPGETVSYKFIWQNNLDAPLANLTLKIKLDGSGFDFGSLEPATGFSLAAKTITLNRDNFPQFFGIQPLEKGEFYLKVKIKETASAGEKLIVSATLDSTSKPEGLAVAKISVAQNLTLEVKTGE